MLIDELPPQRSMPAAERHLMRRELEATISKSTRSWWRLGRGMSLGLGIVVIVAGSAAAGMLIPTKGTLPYVGNGTLQWQQVPDYIAVATSSGALAGYAPRSDVLLPASDNGKPVPNGFGSVPVPVYASNLKTLVGITGHRLRSSRHVTSFAAVRAGECHSRDNNEHHSLSECIFDASKRRRHEHARRSRRTIRIGSFRKRGRRQFPYRSFGHDRENVAIGRKQSSGANDDHH